MEGRLHTRLGTAIDGVTCGLTVNRTQTKNMTEVYTKNWTAQLSWMIDGRLHEGSSRGRASRSGSAPSPRRWEYLLSRRVGPASEGLLELGVHLPRDCVMTASGFGRSGNTLFQIRVGLGGGPCGVRVAHGGITLRGLEQGLVWRALGERQCSRPQEQRSVRSRGSDIPLHPPGTIGFGVSLSSTDFSSRATASVSLLGRGSCSRGVGHGRGRTVQKQHLVGWTPGIRNAPPSRKEHWDQTASPERRWAASVHAGQLCGLRAEPSSVILPTSSQRVEAPWPVVGWQPL